MVFPNIFEIQIVHIEVYQQMEDGEGLTPGLSILYFYLRPIGCSHDKNPIISLSSNPIKLQEEFSF